MSAVAMGDVGRLRCLLYAGLVLAGGSSLMILRQVITRKTAPAGPRVEVISITEAPSIALQAADNARRIGELGLRADLHDDQIRALSSLMHLFGASRGHGGSDSDETAPMPCLSVVREDKPGEGSQAGLCAVGFPAFPAVLRVR
jgi:hypothetical protein